MDRPARLAFVEESWNLVGYKIRPLRDILVCRTDAPPQKFPGSELYLPPKMSNFYGQLPKEVTTYATVMSVGKDAHGVQVGDRIAFTRIFFARLYDVVDGGKIGYVREDQIHGVVEEE